MLPEEMPAAVKALMESHQSWLEDISRLGRRRDAFQFKDTPARLARTFFSALQGALLVKRATGNINQVKDVHTVIRRLVRP